MNKVYFLIKFIMLMSLPVIAFAIPQMPARIGGTLTVVEKQTGTGSSLETGCTMTKTVNIAPDNDEGYKFIVTREDGSEFSPSAEDTDGLNDSDCYVIDIPIYSEENSEGANPGDVAVIHVYKDNNELEVISPPQGRLIVGNGGTITTIDIIAQDQDLERTCYSAQDVEAAVESERQKWDVNNDSRIGLEEAIHALQVITGID